MVIKCRVSSGIGTVLAVDVGNLLHTGPKAAAESPTSVSRSLGLPVQPEETRLRGPGPKAEAAFTDVRS